MLKITEPKKVLCIHDLSGVGRCSLAVILPVLSVMGIQPVALPTVVLSTHTGGFGTPARLDGCAYGEAALEHYRELGLSFDCIYTGYLGGEEQAALAEKAFDLWPSAYKVVDPVMGDNGKAYATVTPAFIDRMRQLCRRADLILPNATEAGLLLEKELPAQLDEESARALADELAAVFRLADGLITGREIGEYGCTGQRMTCARRQRRPEVLADLDAELRAVDFEREVGAEVGLLPRDSDMLVGNPGARREPAVFVELPVVGDIGFGNHAQHFALREDHGAVVERRPVAQGSACDQREGEFARGAHQAFQRLVGRVEQRLLQQEVAAGVGRDAQFGERHDLDAPPGGLLGHRRHPFGVVVAVGDPHVRNGRRHLEKTEIVHRLRDF